MQDRQLPIAQIRKANIEEAAAIAFVHVRSWQVAYRGYMADEFLDNLNVEKRAIMWREVTQDANKIVFVAEDDEDVNIVGFSALGRSRDGDANPSTAEVSAIYVHPQQWAKGIGHALMSASLNEIQKREFDQITLWVLEANQRARSFYESFGFMLDGATKIEDFWKPIAVREIRYRRGLPSGQITS